MAQLLGSSRLSRCSGRPSLDGPQVCISHWRVVQKTEFEALLIPIHPHLNADPLGELPQRSISMRNLGVLLLDLPGDPRIQAHACGFPENHHGSKNWRVLISQTLRRRFQVSQNEDAWEDPTSTNHPFPSAQYGCLLPASF